MFADDTGIQYTAQLADSVEKLSGLVSEFGKVCKRKKLKVNVGESNVMRCCSKLESNECEMRAM